LIEKQADAEQGMSATPSAAPPSDPAPSDAPPSAASTRASKPLGDGSPPSKSTRSGADASGSSLTAAFQKQRGRIESCFRAEPAAAAAQPQLTLRFQIEASGAVRSVELMPAAVAGSALGACVLGVARGTRFPPSDAPVSFTIPITARKTGG
jgi:outer membrane biosynthesis protein TonB